MRSPLLLILLFAVCCYGEYCAEPVCQTQMARLAQSGTYVKRDETLFVIHVTNGTTSIKGSFFPLVDEFSRMELFSSVVLGKHFCRDVNTTVTVEMKYGGSSIMSEPRIYTDSKAFVPYFGIIVKLNEGKPVSIKWDDSCTGCTGDSQRCVGDKTCGIVYGDDDEYLSCAHRDTDIKVFISWLGTDAHGEYMTTAGMALSRLRQFALYPVTASAGTCVNASPSPLGRNAQSKWEKR